MLCGPYYPSYVRMRPVFAGVLRRLYDFVVRYENVLSDGRLETVPAAEVGGWVRLWGVAFSGGGEAGGVWGILRRMPQCITLSLINLTGVTDARWNVPQSVASVVCDLCLEVRVEGVVVGVYAATPDDDTGQLVALGYRLVEREGVTWLQTMLPSLEYWSLILLKTAD